VGTAGVVFWGAFSPRPGIGIVSVPTTLLVSVGSARN
jgi:hypothetical protein